MHDQVQMSIASCFHGCGIMDFDKHRLVAVAETVGVWQLFSRLAHFQES